MPDNTNSSTYGASPLASETPFPKSVSANFHEELRQSVHSYNAKPSNISDQAWLEDYLSQRLPTGSPHAHDAVAEDIVRGIAVYEEKKQSLRAAQDEGMGVDGWLAREVRQGARTANLHEFGQYLTQIDTVIHEANIDLAATITTADGQINQNSNLDGFLFESEHAASFNMDAALKNEAVRAEVLRPEPGQTYAKNSADIAVVDSDGTVLQEYQAKCYKDAESSNAAFENGDYGDQGKLVPEGHAQGDTNSSMQHGKVKSKPVTKEEAKAQQQKVQQEGDAPQKSWNDFTIRELAVNIGRQSLVATAQGAVLSTSISLAVSLARQEEVDGEELVETTVTSGAKSGASCAVAGALKVCAEKNQLPLIPVPIREQDAILRVATDTSSTTVASVCGRSENLTSVLRTSPAAVGILACVAVDGACTAYKVGKGEMTAFEGYLQMEQSTGAAVGGVLASMPAAKAGVALGAMLGPAGAAIGGFVGGVLGGMAGSTVCKKIVEGAQKLREKAVSAVQSVCKTVSSCVSSAFSAVASFFSW